MANPNPIQGEQFKAMQFQKQGDRELGKIVGTRYPRQVEEALDKVGNHQEFIRLAVEQELRAQGFL